MTLSFLKRNLIVFGKYKWLSLASFVVVIGASGVAALQTKTSPIYVANGTLTYNGSPFPLSTNNQIQQQEQTLSEVVLLSNEFIEKVAKDTQVSVEQIRNNIDIALPEKTQIGEFRTSAITVKYKDIDPQRAKKTLLAVMKKIEQQSLERNTNAIQPIKKNINRSLRVIEDKLKEAEKKIAKHDKIQNSELVGVKKENLLKAIADNQNQQWQIQQKLQSINAQKRLGTLFSKTFVLSTFNTDPSLAKHIELINQTESQLVNLESKFLRTHPEVIKLREQLKDYNEILQRRVTQEIITLQQQQNSLKQSKAELEQQHSSVLAKQLTRAPLEKLQHQKARLQAELKDVEEEEAATFSSWIAQEPSVAPEEGFFGKSVPSILGMGALGGVLVSGGLIVLLGSLEGKFQTWEEIGESLQVKQIQLLGVLPLLRDSKTNSPTLPVISLNSPYIEFYERCRINLLSFKGQAVKVVLLSSTVNFEGKTLSAYNLGVVSARAGKKTLIVETDLRSPSQSHCLGVTPTDRVVEPLEYYRNLNQCILPIPEIENLYIVPSPGSMNHATAILESNEMRLLLEFARSQFDLVILDTPALGFFNDALLLEPYSDGIVLVTRPRYTQKKLLSEAIAQLTELEASLLGVIINGVNLSVPYIEVDKPWESHSSRTFEDEKISTGVS